MATTVNEGRVAGLLGREPEAVALFLYSQAAIAIVDARCATLDQALKSMIAEHLTAHYFELGASGAVTSERIGDWAASYASSPLLGSTRNGRIASELDTTGSLMEAGKPKPAFAVL